MKISYPVLLITDVHSHLYNLNQVLAKHPSHTVVCLGDIVNLWDRNTSNLNQQVIDLFMERNIICVKGNHDEHVAANKDTYGITEKMASYLDNLPRSISLELPDNKRYDCHHYRPNDYWGTHPLNFSYLQFCDIYGKNIDVDAVLIGHLHKTQELNFPNKKTKLICVDAL